MTSQNLTVNESWHELVAADGRDAQEQVLASLYDRGRRDMLNAILALNPDVARRYHDLCADEGAEFTNGEGKIPFDVLYWVCAVAEHLGIEPKEIDDV